MSQLVKEVASEVDQACPAPLSMLGMYRVQFRFFRSKVSSRTEVVEIQNPPAGLTATTIALQSFDLFYSDQSQYGYGKLQVTQSVEGSKASCTATLRDNHTNDREWEGTVTGIVTFFGNS
jgi:hypothetical protein